MVGVPRGYFSQAFLDGLKLNIQENTTLLIQQKDTITDEKIEERLYQDVTMADDSQQFFGGNAITYQAVFDLAGGFDTGIFLAVMILIGAYLLIHNVLQISLSRDIRQYGLLKVLGTTGVQFRKVVYRQILTPVEVAKFSEADAGKQKKIRQSTTGGSLAQITFYSCVIAGLLITVGSFCLAGIAYVMKQRIAYFHFPIRFGVCFCALLFFW
ncbi:MAG: hypothetical protein UHO63_00070 [Blautia sp.]|nr:hypothetical protein [Blautia sp.]